jgi:PAS domain S-box-containing protein
MEKLLALVSEAYAQSDDDRAQIERSMDLSSKELLERNRELRIAEEKYRAIFENVSEGISQSTPQGRFISANPALAKICGYESPAALMQQVTDISTQVYARSGRRAEVLKAVEKDGTVADVESEWRRADGQVIWVSETVRAVRDASGAICYYEGSISDITARKSAEAERSDMNARLLTLSRQAGMAEVATGVLHNVGNVLNSVNVSAEVIANHVRNSELASLLKVTELLQAHASHLPSYLADDPQGKLVPDFICELGRCLGGEHEFILTEIASLTRGIDHIKQIVSAQQSIARGSNLMLPTEPTSIMDAAVLMNDRSLERHQIQIVREYEALPAMPLDKHKVLQILINLINNARQAISSNVADATRRLTLIVRAHPTAPQQRVQFIVSDTGIGISAEHLTRIFGHGFTTKNDGHGFGLHSAANAAREMGGSISVESPGRGMGATFTLDLPVTTDQQAEKPCKR